MRKITLTSIANLLLLGSTSLWAQSGPGGVGTTDGTSNLKLWLQADVGVTAINNLVSNWADQSGSSNDVINATSGSQPSLQQNGANSMPYLQFDGSNDFLQLSTASADFSATESSIIVVAEGALTNTVVSVAQTGIVQEMLMRGNAIFHHSSSGNFRTRGHQCLGNIPSSEARILGGIFGTTVTDLQLYSNGLASTSTVSGAGGVSYSNVNRLVRIGRRSNGEYLNGRIYEVIIYDRKLTTAEQDSIGEYLRCKYDLDNNTCGNLSTIACSSGPALTDGPGGVGGTSGNTELKLWLKADVGITTGASSTVVTWEDQSGYNNDVSSANSTALRPRLFQNGANTMPYVRFDGSNDYLQIPAASTDFSRPEASIFVVAEGNLNSTVVSIAQTGIVQEMLMRGNNIFHHSSSGNFRNRVHQCVITIPSTEARVLGAIFGTTPTDLEFYSNGLASTSSVSGSGGSNYSNVNRQVRIGRRSNGEYLSGSIYEVIIYDRQLTAVEQDSVEDYLRCKYGIDNNGCGDLSSVPCNTGMNVQQSIPVQEVQLFPNPTNNHLSILTENTTLTRIEVLSLTGQVIQTVTLNSQNYELDVQDLPTGVYFLRLEDNRQAQLVQKFVKQ